MAMESRCAPLKSPSLRSWAIVLPVALYSLIVYPLLFTGTLRLNLNQPNLAAGVAFNGFAAGALEELVFRGLILALANRDVGQSQAEECVVRNSYFSAFI